MSLKGKLNLELAWKRYKYDQKERSFSDSPFESEIIDDNFKDWAFQLDNALDDYCPSRSEIINIPKKDFHIRPGTLLTSEDAAVYNALLLLEIDKIISALEWNSGVRSWAYVLKKNQTTNEWFTNQYRSWDSFRQKSATECKIYPWVVFADVSAYFENISLDRLISDLTDMGLSREVTDLLQKCLRRWTEPKSRGIPQGNGASSILGNVYFNSIDMRMSNRGLIYYRYLDDIRIFCGTLNQAVQALHLLTMFLREKELNLNTGKTFIRYGQDALNEIDTVTDIIRTIENKIKSSAHKAPNLKPLVIYESGYIISDSEEPSPNDEDLKVVYQAFEEHMVSASFDFDKSLFHYCINNLGAAKDNYAVEFCLEALTHRSEEWEHILKYFSKLDGQRSDIAEKIIDLLNGNRHSLERHFFLVSKWIYQNRVASQKVLHFCRNLLLKTDIHDHTKHYAMAILGDFGDSSDLDAIEAEYSTAKREITKAVIICSIKRMVKTRRNSMYKRAEQDGQKVKFAIKASKNSD
jgi:retron-type reverse transcriptase